MIYECINVQRWRLKEEIIHRTHTGIRAVNAARWLVGCSGQMNKVWDLKKPHKMLICSEQRLLGSGQMDCSCDWSVAPVVSAAASWWPRLKFYNIKVDLEHVAFNS